MSDSIGIGFRELLTGLVIIFLIIFVYFAPTLLARHLRHKNSTAIFILNLFGGWLFIPWLIALVWAIKKPESETA